MAGGDRETLIEEVIAALRADGSARDALDQAVADRLRINLTDLRCLDVLEQHGTSTPGEIATALGLTSGAVTTLLDRLENRGYVQRRRDAQDRRRVFVEPTAYAHRLAGELYGPIGTEGRALLAELSPRDLALLRDFMRRSRELQLRHEARIRSQPPAAPRAPPAR
ncbi:MAG TPA: MarR family transcriptional regulator [Solirubrobacteraceae bacterium]|nr:MarR family transcriptional regulator [Solirubrobacteraceae bacterium]